jgi:hypothetical protein
MTIDELVPLTNGLSVSAGAHTFVCERTRITPLKEGALDMAFWIAGTDYRPRVRLTNERVSQWSPNEVARILGRVVREAVTGERSRRASRHR